MTLGPPTSFHKVPNRYFRRPGVLLRRPINFLRKLPASMANFPQLGVPAPESGGGLALFASGHRHVEGAGDGDHAFVEALQVA